MQGAGGCLAPLRLALLVLALAWVPALPLLFFPWLPLGRAPLIWAPAWPLLLALVVRARAVLPGPLLPLTLPWLPALPLPFRPLLPLCLALLA